MSRHLIAPTGAPSWGQYAYGLIGLPAGSELELRTVSEEDGFNAADLVLLTLQEGSSSSGDELAYLVAIYNGLTAFFTGSVP